MSQRLNISNANPSTEHSFTSANLNFLPRAPALTVRAEKMVQTSRASGGVKQLRLRKGKRAEKSLEMQRKLQGVGCGRERRWRKNHKLFEGTNFEVGGDVHATTASVLIKARVELQALEPFFNLDDESQTLQQAGCFGAQKVNTASQEHWNFGDWHHCSIFAA